MNIKSEISELNERIDSSYQAYHQQLIEKANKRNEIASNCNALMGVIDSERHLMRIEIEKMYHFLEKFGEFKKHITLFDFIAEGRVEMSMIQPRPKIDKVIYNSDIFRRKKKNENNLMQKENELGKEKESQNNQLAQIDDMIHTNEIIWKIIDMYRISITTVKDAVTNIYPEFELMEAFIIADRIKDAVINEENPHDISTENYNINLYKNTPYHRYYLFVRNVFDYYQFITTVYTKCILKDIIADSIVTEEEQLMFEAQLEEVDRKSKDLLAFVQEEG